MLNSPPTKKRKLDSTRSHLPAAVFPNPCDEQQFTTILNLVEGSQLIKNLQIPCIISREIAEFATGQILQCFSANCKRDILLLHEHKDCFDIIIAPDAIIDDELEAVHILKERDSEANQYAARVVSREWEHAEYFCAECMKSMKFLCANYRCRCQLTASFTVNCSKCKSCDRCISDCDERCEFQCFCAWRCHSCGDTYCQQGDCTDIQNRCCSCYGRTCTNCCVTDDKEEISYVICPECYVDTYVECESPDCAVKCKLLYESNDRLYPPNEEKPAMERCVFCEKFVCFQCSSMWEKATGGGWRLASGAKRSCKHCGSNIACCCDEHQPVNGVCSKCLSYPVGVSDRYNAISIEALCDIIDHIYCLSDRRMTKKKIRKEIASMFDMSSNTLREDEKYSAAFEMMINKRNKFRSQFRILYIIPRKGH